MTSFGLVLAAAFALVEGGRPVATVVAPASARAAVSFFNAEAAKCLQGQTFRVTERPDDSGRNLIVDIRRALPETEDAYEIDFPDDRTMRVSCSGTSVRFALARILRDAFGVRWLFAAPKGILGEELNEYPPARDVSMEMKPVRQRAMSYWLLREADWREMEFKRHAWANKGHRLVHGLLLDVIPIYKYAEKGDFPKEYWSVQEPGGPRVGPKRAKGPLSDNIYIALRDYCGSWNPCFSNPDAVPVAVRDILERLAQNPEQTSVNIEICDNGHMCRCERCLSAVGGRRNSMNFEDYGRVYWPFVAQVAARVKARRPDVIFSTIAYREVNDPPAEKLPENVMVRLCFEHSAMIDPEVAAVRRKTLADWSEKCSLIEFYDYNHGSNFYLLPRVHFSFQGDRLREFHERYNARGYYTECTTRLPFEGPKLAVTSRLLEDVSADPQQLLSAWCADCVGEAAAPSLLAYWRFWEEYSTGRRIRETSWFRHSRFNIYLMFGQASQAYALCRGDMARQRARMEEVLSRAVTPLQKRRAAVLMDMHRLAEDAATAVFAECLEPDGTVRTREAALDLLKTLPSALAAADRRRSSKYAKWDLMAVDEPLRGGLGAVLPYGSDAVVRSVLLAYARDESIPVDIRGLFRAWCGRAGRNLVENGSFEAERPYPGCWRGGRALGGRTQDLASDGAWSFGGVNPMLEYKVRIEPDKTYVLMLDAYAEKGSSEGRFNFCCSPYAGGSPRTHVTHYGMTLPAGKWQTFTAVVRGGRRGEIPDDEMYVNVFGKKYERGERVCVDNVRVYCVEEMEKDER